MLRSSDQRILTQVGRGCSFELCKSVEIQQRCVLTYTFYMLVPVIIITITRWVRSPNGGHRPLHRRAMPRSGLPSFSPNCWGTGGGWGVGWKWAHIGGLQYQTHMQAPKYDVQFLRSEALCSSSSSSSRMRQIKECKISGTMFMVLSSWQHHCIRHICIIY